MTTPRLPSRNSSFASQSTTSSQEAALHGATTAFSRSTSTTRVPGISGMNGARAAASSAGTRSKPQTSEQWPATSSPYSLKRTTTGASVQSVKSNAAESVRSLNVSSMGLTPESLREDDRSPSHHAALAAARNLVPENDAAQAPRRSATTRRPAAPPKPRRLSSYGYPTDRKEMDRPTDSSPIAPTTSLVDLFERKASGPQSTAKRPEPIVIKPSGDLPLKSPTPVRNTSGITSLIQMHVDEGKATLPPAPTVPVSKAAENGVEKAQPPLRSLSPPFANPKSDSGPAVPPRKRDIARNAGVSDPPPLRLPDISRGRPIYLDPKKSPTALKSAPSPLRTSTTDPIPIQQINRRASSPMERFSPSAASLKSLPAQYNLIHPRRGTPNMTGDQLVNAMVASSLASSRQSSPARTMDPPPLPTRRHKHHTFSFSREPSPAKTPGLRKTLRTQQDEISEDDDDEEGHYSHGKRRVQKRIGKHPNKHHEGDRKRWREAVSDRERKRYEGVWAANKGLYSSFSREEYAMVTKAPKSQEAHETRDALSYEVSNLVVRDIWSRSRLPDTVLELVWDLVDNRQVGRLNREEFVVGLWLIDGRLKGKKLPIRVTDSVWRSVRGLQGIKIKQ